MQEILTRPSSSSASPSPAPLTLVLIWLLTLPFLAYSLTAIPALKVDVGNWEDQAILQGAYKSEQSSDGNYRWTAEQSTISFPQLSAAYRILDLEAHGWRPSGLGPRVDMRVNGRPWGQFQMSTLLRHYVVLLPEQAFAQELQIDLHAEPFEPAGDDRVVGIGIHHITLQKLVDRAAPSWPTFAMEALFLALMMVLLGIVVSEGLGSKSLSEKQQSATTPRRQASCVGHENARITPVHRAAMRDAELRTPFQTASENGRRASLISRALLYFPWIGVASAFVLMNIIQPLWIGVAIKLWLPILVLLLIMTLLVKRWLDRSYPDLSSSRLQAHPKTDNPGELERLLCWLPKPVVWAVWTILLCALGVRLLGAAHPLFDSHDLTIHTRWLGIVIPGHLALYSTPGELQNRLTFNPPVGYVLLEPVLLLLNNPRLTVQLSTALIDWLGCVFFVLIAFRLRLAWQASLIALLLYVFLPINMTMLWWGFATNNMAQTCWLVLLWLILRLEDMQQASRSQQIQAIFSLSAIATFCFLMHVGALVLMLPMLALLALVGCWRLPRQGARVLVAGLTLAGTLSILLYFSYVLPNVLTQHGVTQNRPLIRSVAASQAIVLERIGLVAQAFHIGYTLPLLVAAAMGFLLLMGSRRVHALQAALLWSTLGLSAIFATVYVVSAFLTRYIYFAAPVICLSAASFLERVRHRPGGRYLLMATLVLVAWMGLELWFGGVLLRDKPSLVPLTQ